jgi:hypothetical protein
MFLVSGSRAQDSFGYAQDRADAPTTKKCGFDVFPLRPLERQAKPG